MPCGACEEQILDSRNKAQENANVWSEFLFMMFVFMVGKGKICLFFME